MQTYGYICGDLAFFTNVCIADVMMKFFVAETDLCRATRERSREVG